MTKAIIVCGSPGAGKSTYAKKLAAKNKVTLLDIDTCTETLVRLSLKISGNNPDDRDSQYFKDTYREAIYETLFKIAKENLLHNDVIVVGPFTKELSNPDWNAELEKQLQTEVEIHYLQCTSEELKQRLENRNNPRDRAKLQDWAGYTKYFDRLGLPSCKYTLVEISKI